MATFRVTICNLAVQNLLLDDDPNVYLVFFFDEAKKSGPRCFKTESQKTYDPVWKFQKEFEYTISDIRQLNTRKLSIFSFNRTPAAKVHFGSVEVDLHTLAFGASQQLLMLRAAWTNRNRIVGALQCDIFMEQISPVRISLSSMFLSDSTYTQQLECSLRLASTALKQFKTKKASKDVLEIELNNASLKDVTDSALVIRVKDKLEPSLDATATILLSSLLQTEKPMETFSSFLQGASGHPGEITGTIVFSNLPACAQLTVGEHTGLVCTGQKLLPWLPGPRVYWTPANDLKSLRSSLSDTKGLTPEEQTQADAIIQALGENPLPTSATRLVSEYAGFNAARSVALIENGAARTLVRILQTRRNSIANAAEIVRVLSTASEKARGLLEIRGIFGALLPWLNDYEERDVVAAVASAIASLVTDCKENILSLTSLGGVSALCKLLHECGDVPDNVAPNLLAALKNCIADVAACTVILKPLTLQRAVYFLTASSPTGRARKHALGLLETICQVSFIREVPDYVAAMNSLIEFLFQAAVDPSYPPQSAAQQNIRQMVSLLLNALKEAPEFEPTISRHRHADIILPREAIASPSS
eukprot:TRINITY_DN5261_c0_g1_i1.p1 TRINITY_DN5261_c0_g1~~TRINITY_DN5261_c0_g1_i1.p1  ORF type:complete len:589 (+),score=76.00 TRINITY_DN5261_c0_g1_i1:22-1788(+)